MKYFTVELLNRFRSDDEDVAALAHNGWENALKRYGRREAQIKPALPEGVRRFLNEHVGLHDARLLNMGSRGDTFVMILERDPPSRELVILMFKVDGDPRISDTALMGTSGSAFVTWMYEEWHTDRRQRCWFEVLLSNGWVVKLHVRSFQYLMVQPVIPNTNGQAASLSSKAIPQSA